MKPPFNDTTVKHVKLLVYAMKRQYGAVAYIRRRLTTFADPQTGERGSSVQTVRVQRMVVLQGVVTRDAKQSISLITAQKQMVQGGGFDVGKRTFIIDRGDVPYDFDLKKDDWIVFNSKHFEIEQLIEYEYKTAWVVIGKEIKGRTEGMDIYFPSVTDSLQVTDSVTH